MFSEQQLQQLQSLELREFKEEPPLIQWESLDIERQENILRVLGKLSESEKEMPFFHFTPMEIKKNGVTEEVSAFRDILEKGLKANTNGSTFVSRNSERNAKLVSPEELKDDPVQVLEDLRLILKKYLFHGERTNRATHGHHGKSIKDGKRNIQSMGNGVPVLFMFDRTDVSMKRGDDGDEHYVVLSRIPRNRFIGMLEIDSSIDSDNREDVLKFSDKIFNTIESWLDGETTMH